MKKVVIAIHIVFACFIVIITSCSDNKMNQDKKKNIKVTTMKASAGSNINQKDYIGTVEEENISELSFPVSGQISGIYISEGQKVQKGQRLASLDMTNLQNSNTAAKASYEQAKDGYERMKKLYDNGSLPEIKYIDAKTKLDQAESAYSITKKQLADAVIYAPFDGVISKRSISPGENVIPGKAVLSLSKTDNLKVRFAVPEKEISEIAIGSEADINIPSLKNGVYTGNIIEKGITTSALSPLYEVKVLINNNEGRILPGMTCRVNIQKSNESDQVIIPARSVMLDGKGNKYVWVMKDGKAEQTFIETGDFLKDGVIVESGLNEGDKVVTKGYQKISNGMNITEE